MRKIIKLEKTIFDSQKNNPQDPYVTCFPTSIRMHIATIEQKIYGGRGREKYLDPKLEEIWIRDIEKNKEEYVKKTVELAGKWAEKYHPRTVYAFWVWYINKKLDGFHAEYNKMSQGQLRKYIDKNELPVTIGTKLTHGGHIVLCIGYDEKGFTVNDPYGWARSSKRDYKNYPSSKNKEDGDYSTGRTKNQWGHEVYYENKRLLTSMNCITIKNK